MTQAPTIRCTKCHEETPMIFKRASNGEHSYALPDQFVVLSGLDQTPPITQDTIKRRYLCPKCVLSMAQWIDEGPGPATTKAKK